MTHSASHPTTHTVIAIDGPAASGKSTAARLLARRLGFGFVNSGSLYRAMTLAMLRRGVDVSDPHAVAAALAPELLTSGMTHGASWVAIDGERVDDSLESGQVNAAVSQVATVPEVRAEVVRQLRAFAAHGPIVMEGRDIATIVFPGTPWKFYIDASEEVRQQRRASQGMVDSVRDRDRVDSSRASAPLMVAQGALVVDSSDLSAGGVVEVMVASLRERGLEVSPA